MSIGPISEHIEIVERPSGPTPRIIGSRIRVVDIVGAKEAKGWEEEEIARQYPTIKLAEVYAAFAYYLDHKDELDRYMEDADAEFERSRAQYPSILQDKLRRIAEEKSSLPPR